MEEVVMTDTNEVTFGSSRMAVGRNYIAVDPKEWREQNAVLFQLPETHYATFHLSEAEAIRDHLTLLIDEIRANLPAPAVAAPVGTVLVHLVAKDLRAAKIDEDTWVSNDGLVWTDADIVWEDWEEYAAVKRAEAVTADVPIEPDPDDGKVK
jgi:hypothetical protein